MSQDSRKMKGVRVFVEGSVFRTAKNEKDFLLGLYLLRFSSRLRSYQRIYLRIPDDGVPTNAQDRVNVTLLMGATLFEGLKAFKLLQPDLKELPLFNTVVDTVEKLTLAISAESDLKPVLDVLRNKVMFHFDRGVLCKAVKKSPESPELDLLSGPTERHVDLVFPLVEDSLLSFIISKDDGPGTDPEKYGNLERNVLEYSTSLCEVHEILALDLLDPWVKIT